MLILHHIEEDKMRFAFRKGCGFEKRLTKVLLAVKILIMTKVVLYFFIVLYKETKV
jgi:hypothetical protein